MRAMMVLSVGVCLMLSGCRGAPIDESNDAGVATQPTYWVGTWSTMQKLGGELHASVTPTGDGSYEAVFAGTCSEAFLYELTLPGFEHNDTVHFEGDVDLGEKDGGVYSWAGAIIGDTFIGEYRNAKYKVGSFRMYRATQEQFEASAMACGAMPAAAEEAEAK